MSDDLFHSLSGLVKSDIPGFSIAYKEDSLMMKAAGRLLAPFNPGFMGNFITTIGNTVYFPADAKTRPDDYARVLAHEYVHMCDFRKNPVGFVLGYTFPQNMAIPLLVLSVVFCGWLPLAALLVGVAIAYLVHAAMPARAKLVAFCAMAGVAALGSIGLAIYLSHFWSLLMVGGLVVLGPWSSHWRAKSEYRGYAMTLAWESWTSGAVSGDSVEWIAGIFTGFDYLRMDPNKSRVNARLLAIVEDCKSGKIVTGDDGKPYATIMKFLYDRGMIRG